MANSERRPNMSVDVRRENVPSEMRRLHVVSEQATIRLRKDGETVGAPWVIREGVSTRLYEWRIKRRTRKAERKADRIRDEKKPVFYEDLPGVTDLAQ